MFKIWNFDEKKLYVARYAIRKSMKTMDGRRFYEIWSSYWKHDWRLDGRIKFKVVEKGDIFELVPPDSVIGREKEIGEINKSFLYCQKWINGYLDTHTTMDDVDNDIIGLHDKQRRILISKFKSLNYYVRMSNKAINNRNVMQYHIWKGSAVKGGSFDLLMGYYRELLKNKKNGEG